MRLPRAVLSYRIYGRLIRNCCRIWSTGKKFISYQQQWGHL